MKRCVKSSHFPPSEKWALKEAKTKNNKKILTHISEDFLACCTEKDITTKTYYMSSHYADRKAGL